MRDQHRFRQDDEFDQLAVVYRADEWREAGKRQLLLQPVRHQFHTHGLLEVHGWKAEHSAILVPEGRCRLLLPVAFAGQGPGCDDYPIQAPTLPGPQRKGGKNVGSDDTRAGTVMQEQLKGLI